MVRWTQYEGIATGGRLAGRTTSPVDSSCANVTYPKVAGGQTGRSPPPVDADRSPEQLAPQGAPVSAENVARFRSGPRGRVSLPNN
jgi:hypothetical protein